MKVLQNMSKKLKHENYENMLISKCSKSQIKLLLKLKMKSLKFLNFSWDYFHKIYIIVFKKFYAKTSWTAFVGISKKALVKLSVCPKFYKNIILIISKKGLLVPS